MLKFGNKEFRNIQEQVEKNAKDIEKLIEEGSELPSEKPTDNGQILLGNINGSVEWSTETIREFQHELVSGENIKTINNESILGSGNIEINVNVDSTLSTTSTNSVQNKVITAALNSKANSSDVYTQTETSSLLADFEVGIHNNFYDKTQVDSLIGDINTVLDNIPNTYATKTSVTEISNTVNDIPTTYATKTTVDNLETQLRQEIGNVDSRVTTLENKNDGFNPADSVTDDQQILIGYVNGSYTWSTQTLPELLNTIDAATTNISGLDTRVTALDTKVISLSDRVTTLEQTAATKAYVDNLILGSLQGSY